MEKPKYRLLEEFLKSLKDHDSENIIEFIDDLVSKGQTIKGLCEHIREPRSDRISRFRDIKSAMNSYLIALIKENKFATLRELRERTSADFVGESPYFGSLTKVLDFAVSIEGSTETSVKAFHQILLQRFALHERQPFHEALIEAIGPEQWTQMQAEALVNLDKDGIEKELSFIKRKNLLEPFLFFLVKTAELNTLDTKKIVKFNQLIELIIDLPSLREILQPDLIVLYSLGSFNGKHSLSVKQSIEKKIFGDRKPLLVREIAGFEDGRLALKRELEQIKEQFESKKLEYLAAQEFDKDYRWKMKVFKDKTTRFYEKWRDEEIAKVLVNLLEIYLLVEDIFRHFDKKHIKTANTDSSIERIEALRGLIMSIFREYDAEMIGRPGDLAQYNQMEHETNTGKLTNRRVVKIVKPGLRILDKRGALKYILRKALVA